MVILYVVPLVVGAVRSADTLNVMPVAAPMHTITPAARALLDSIHVEPPSAE